MPSSKAPPRLRPARLRPVRARLFVDEAGQFPARPGSTVTLACFFMPADATDDRLLAELVTRLRASRGGVAVKARTLTDAELDEIAGLVHDRWCFGHLTVPVGREAGRFDPAEFGPLLLQLQDVLRVKRRELRYQRGRLLTLDRLDRAIEKAAIGQSIYTMLLLSLLVRCADWFTKNRLAPQVDVWIDDIDLPLDVIGLIVRLVFMQTDPHNQGKLGELLGVDECVSQRAYLSTDDDTPGLVMADIIAHAAHVIANPKHHDHASRRDRWERVLAAMTNIGPSPAT